MTDDSRIGVDVGGTFTDVVTFDGDGLHLTKTPSTPDAPDEGVAAGLDEAARTADLDLAALGDLVHGTTVATNAALEGTWADAALVTTAGFRDVLEIGRQDRPDLYDLTAGKPDPVIPRDRRFEVDERLDERGEVIEPLDEASVEAVAETIAESDAESVAVCLLFAFENDVHERRVREVLREHVECPISLSSEVYPEIREYGRGVTTALNAALVPVMADYFGSLDDRLTERGIETPLRIMGSNGGTMALAAARERPVETLLSGPAGGVRGAAHVADLAGFSDAITMDMGGTSCDVSLVRDGDPVVSTEVEVGGYPVGVPMIDVHTIGAGGGSLAWVDDGGALRVGPRSVGADPGPICYGRGGTEPTVTDAHYLLGRLDPAQFSHDFDPDRDAVREGFETHLAEPLDMDIEAAARGVLSVANANMERALRVVSVERGHDPRNLALVSFGGAGPLHAVALARELDVPRVAVPRAAGGLSALGLLASDAVYDLSTSRVRDWDAVDPDDLAGIFRELEAEGDDRLAKAGLSGDRRAFERALDVRYAGQSFELTIDAPDELNAGALDAVADRFHERHRDRYGHASPGEPLELVAVRLRARGRIDPPPLDPPSSGTVEGAIREERPVAFGDDRHETPVYDRGGLPPDGSFEGPAVVEGTASTLVVPLGDGVRVDEYGNLLVEVV